jgi:hypothetical protein
VSRRDHASDLAWTRASYLRALTLLRMRCAPGDPHYTSMLVQELQERGEVVQQALNDDHPDDQGASDTASDKLIGFAPRPDR